MVTNFTGSTVGDAPTSATCETVPIFSEPDEHIWVSVRENWIAEAVENGRLRPGIKDNYVGCAWNGIEFAVRVRPSPRAYSFLSVRLDPSNAPCSQLVS